MTSISCPHCHKELPENAEFCGHCGGKIVIDQNKDYQAVEQPQKINKPEVKQNIPGLHPWRRWLARTTDVWVFSYIFIIILAFIYPAGLKTNTTILGLFSLFIWGFVEAFLLSSWGMTPGKWLMNITIRDSKSIKLTYDYALQRFFKIWFRGLGLGIPIVSLITEYNAYSNLIKNGSTTWDSEGNATVTHGRIGAGRIVLTVICWAIILLIYSASSSNK